MEWTIRRKEVSVKKISPVPLAEAWAITHFIRCCWSPVRQRKRRAYHFAHFRGLYPTSVLNGLLCHVWGAGTQHRSERRTGRSFFNTERHTLLSDNRKNDQRLRSLWKGFPDSMPFNTSSLLLLLYHKKFCKSDGREPRRQDWASMS